MSSRLPWPGKALLVHPLQVALFVGKRKCPRNPFPLKLQNGVAGGEKVPIHFSVVIPHLFNILIALTSSKFQICFSPFLHFNLDNKFLNIMLSSIETFLCHT